MRIRTCWII